MQVQYVLTEKEYKEYKDLLHSKSMRLLYENIIEDLKVEYTRLETLVKLFLLRGNKLSVDDPLIFANDPVPDNYRLVLKDSWSPLYGRSISAELEKYDENL